MGTCGLVGSVKIAGWRGEGVNGLSTLAGLPGNVVDEPSFKDEQVGVRVRGAHRTCGEDLGQSEGHFVGVRMTSS